MSMSVSIRVAHKSPSLAKGQRHHDTRSSHIPDYVDKSQTHRNDIIVEPAAEKMLRDMCLERRALRDTQRAMKKDAAIATVGIITFGKEAQPVIESLPETEQNRLYLEAANKIAERLKTDVTGLVVHRDERSPHAHFQMCAYAKDGMPLSKVITPSVAKEMQDIAGSVYAEFDISRGTPKAERIKNGEDFSATIHRSVSKLHSDLPAEVAMLKERASKALKDAKDKVLKYDALADKAKTALSESTDKEAAVQKRLAIYEKRSDDAQKKADDLERKISDLLKKEAVNVPLPKSQIIINRHGLLGKDELDVVLTSDVKKYVQSMSYELKKVAAFATYETVRADSAEERERTLVNDPEIKSLLTARAEREAAIAHEAERRKAWADVLDVKAKEEAAKEAEKKPWENEPGQEKKPEKEKERELGDSWEIGR